VLAGKSPQSADNAILQDKTMQVDLPNGLPRSLAEWGYSRESLLDALRTQVPIPVFELGIATVHADEVEQDIIDVIERACTEELDGPSARLLFRGLHILGGRRLSAAYRPCIAFLRSDKERVEDLLSDAIGDTLPGILAGAFDGDLEPLLGLITDEAANQFVRGSALVTLALLTFDGRIARDFTEDFLARFERTGTPENDWVWHDWMLAVALLGFDRLTPRVKAVFSDGRIPSWVDDETHYQEVLAAALERPDDASRFKDEGIWYIDDVLEALRRYAFELGDEDLFESNEEDVFERGMDEWSPSDWEPQTPARNPFRDVGRNDPCPCGSGKKFKKCCGKAG
jgi:hypothetical protein